MIEPVLRDDALIDEIRSTPATDGFALWWLGQSGFLVKYQDHHLLFDPYLSDSLTKKYAGTDKPHVRMSARVVDPARLDFIDVVTSSHNHTDHLDAETLRPLLASSPRLKIVIPEANRAFAAERLQVEPQAFLGLRDGESLTLSPFEIHAVPAAHEVVDRDEEGRCRYLGYIVRFGAWSVYHAGDTVRYHGMVKALEPFAVDVALLPINGRRPERRVPGNLFGDEAAELASAIRARVAIPCHFEMFEFNHESPDLFLDRCDALGQSSARLRVGERWTTEELPPGGATKDRGGRP